MRSTFPWARPLYGSPTIRTTAVPARLNRRISRSNQGCGFVEAFEHVDLAVLADKRDGESVAVRMKADAPGQDGVRRRIQRGELLLDAGFDIDRDQPLNGVLRCRVPVKIERNERQRCLIKNAGSWRLWSRSEPEKRRNHSGATTPAMILSHY